MRHPSIWTNSVARAFPVPFRSSHPLPGSSLPVSYTVTEAEKAGFTQESATDASGTAYPNKPAEVLFVNTYSASVQYYPTVKKTLENVQANPKVAIVFWKGTEAYELYGTARYVNEGEEFTSQKEWVDAAFEKMGLPIKAKGGCYVHIDEVFSSAPGPQAGVKLA